jgi:putative transposase
MGGRFKSCLVGSDDYLLRCYCYIDLNPVRARMIDDAERFRWSSCGSHCGEDDALIQHHRAYLGLGISMAERVAAYRAFLCEALSEESLLMIRAYLQQQRALGSDEFRAMVEAKTRRFAGIRPAHRPSNRSAEK